MGLNIIIIKAEEIIPRKLLATTLAAPLLAFAISTLIEISRRPCVVHFT